MIYLLIITALIIVSFTNSINKIQEKRYISDSENFILNNYKLIFGTIFLMLFFIYPTMFLNRKDFNWNADLDDQLLNKNIINRSVKYQASAFGKVGNIYVPFYRQSHYKVYVKPFNNYEEKSRAIAYSDIKKAFKYYLDNSLMLVTALAPKIGYDNAAKIAKTALNNNTTLKFETLKTGLISEKDYDKIVDPKKMIYPA